MHGPSFERPWCAGGGGRGRALGAAEPEPGAGEPVEDRPGRHATWASQVLGSAWQCFFVLFRGLTSEEEKLKREQKVALAREKLVQDSLRNAEAREKQLKEIVPLMEADEKNLKASRKTLKRALIVT